MIAIVLCLLGLTIATSWWLTGWLARTPSFGAPDLPSDRSLHSMPMPRTGGVAIIAAVALALAIAAALAWLLGRPELMPGRDLGLALTGAAVLAGHAFWSDFRGASVPARLGVQLAVAVIAVLGADLTLGVIPLRPLGWLVTIVTLAWMTNLYNFMDGMDGFAGGMTILGFAALAALEWRGGQPPTALLAILIAAATAGFLLLNFPPARIFMGDVGSIPLGFLAGCVCLMGVRDQAFDLWTPLLIFSPFIVDATVTLVRRVLRGEAAWRPHREHYYQRLVLAGWGHRRTVLVEYGLMLGCTASAAVYASASGAVQVFLLLSWGAVYCFLVYGVHATDTARLRSNIEGLPLAYRRPLVITLQLAAAILSHHVAFWLRFDGDVPPAQMVIFVGMLPWLIVIRALSFIPFRLYEGLWRYAGLWDLRNIVGATLSGSVAFFALVHWGFGLTGYPRSVFLIDSLVLILLLGGMRMVRRLYREAARLDRSKRVLIYGAGNAGEMIARDMRTNRVHGYVPVGFIDDDLAKVGRRIHGVKVRGTRGALRAVLAATRPDAVLIAISRAEPATIRSIVEALEPFKVPIQRLPSLRDLLDRKVTVDHIRTLAVEDLLDRVPVALDAEPVREIVAGKRVLVTGAGGSIGAELCRQIASLGPASLVMLDRYENGLHAVTNEVARGAFGRRVHAVVVDVTDRSRMREVWDTHRPTIVFHAAAHKHVPLMELNPCEAVLNNVRGARMLVESAVAYGVERFMLVSTDKAVNPASIMGATKRIAEMLVQTVNGDATGVFAAVRFGNVLASNGSVVPLFLEQILTGGPVTVTHADMRRYFMLIPEAVSLVLQAITLAKGSDIFALEMGEQVGVLELARNLIRLSGFVPERDIPIVFTGVRPGEKLREELVGEDEEMEPSSVDGILRIRPRTTLERAPLISRILELEGRAEEGDRAGVIGLLQAIVATYHPRGD